MRSRTLLPLEMAATLALVCAVAQAQEVSDLMPPPPKPQAAQPGSAGVYLPGMPVPQPSVAPQPTTSPDPKVREAPKGLNLGYDDQLGVAPDYTSEGSEAASMSTADRTAEFHVVRKGDTLWSVASAYLGTPWQWPKLWSLNPSITNPHWIFPGDTLRLHAGAGEPMPSTSIMSPVGEPKLPSRRNLSTGYYLRHTGFVEPHELEVAGKIKASKEEKQMLSSDDEAYVEYKKGQLPKIGDRLSIYAPTTPVKNPVTGKKIGYFVEIYADAEVISVTEGKLARIRVRDSIEPSERGFLVGPLRREFKIVESRKNTNDVAGIICGMMRLGSMVAQDMIVFLDQGRNAGLDVGNRLLITRRGDGVVPILAIGPIDDKAYPRESIGEILVLDVHENVATGVVIKSSKEARIGDRFEAHPGF